MVNITESSSYQLMHATPQLTKLSSILSGKSLISTMNLALTSSIVSSSSLEEMKLMAAPLVPKRPALPTWKGKKVSHDLPRAYSVEIGIRGLSHVVVEHQVDSLEIHASGLNIGDNHDPLLSLFEHVVLLHSGKGQNQHPRLTSL